jgi:hypothetical protein
LAQATPDAAGTFSESWELPAGRYCAIALDSYGDGGLSGVVSVDSINITSWAADSYTNRSEVCFNVGLDCAGTLNGDAVEDECGVCDADPTNDCAQDCEGTWSGTAEGCGNVTLWLTCDENLEEVRWAVAGVDGYLDQGAPTQAYTSLGWELPASVYRFLVYDSGENGGCAGEIQVNGETVSAWPATAYEDIAVVDITVE